MSTISTMPIEYKYTLRNGLPLMCKDTTKDPFRNMSDVIRNVFGFPYGVTYSEGGQNISLIVPCSKFCPISKIADEETDALVAFIQIDGDDIIITLYPRIRKDIHYENRDEEIIMKNLFNIIHVVDIYRGIVVDYTYDVLTDDYVDGEIPYLVHRHYIDRDSPYKFRFPIEEEKKEEDTCLPIKKEEDICLPIKKEEEICMPRKKEEEICMPRKKEGCRILKNLKTFFGF